MILIQKNVQVDGGWWQGLHKKTGRVGLFPANYVQLDENIYMNIEEVSPYVQAAGSYPYPDAEEIYEMVQ